MQTFVPYGTDFYATARCLDDKRLGKQRVEAYQILRALLNENHGWKNHPATKMWYGYEEMLVVYTQIICGEWMSRGYEDTVADKVTELAGNYWNGRYGYFEPMTNTFWWRNLNDKMVEQSPPLYWYPVWLNDTNLVASHRSNLVHKCPWHYGPMWPSYLDADRHEYVWPPLAKNPPLRHNTIVKDIGDGCKRNPYLFNNNNNNNNKEVPA